MSLRLLRQVRIDGVSALCRRARTTRNSVQDGTSRAPATFASHPPFSLQHKSPESKSGQRALSIKHRIGIGYNGCHDLILALSKNTYDAGS